jgi:hypothetical protein
MANYSITINEKMAMGKSIVAFLHLIPQVVTFEIPKKKEKPKNWLYYELEEAFKDVRLMMDGKKPKKTLDELIDELRREKADELRNNND